MTTEMELMGRRKVRPPTLSVSSEIHAAGAK